MQLLKGRELNLQLPLREMSGRVNFKKSRSQKSLFALILEWKELLIVVASGHRGGRGTEGIYL